MFPKQWNNGTMEQSTMPHQDISTFSKRFTILIGLTVVSAMAFGLSISFYRNILFEETLETLSARNRALRASIDDGLDELSYYRSLQYRDKYAKENLGKLNTGEKVLILTDEPEPVYFSKAKDSSYFDEKDALYKQYLESIPTIEHWRLYLFDSERLQKLKSSF
jgi:cell division protein FtsB